MQKDWDQLEGRNVVIEALRRNRRAVRRVFLDVKAKKDPKIKYILQQVERRNIPLQRVPRQELDKKSKTGVHNGVIALAEGLPTWTTNALLNHLFASKIDPFLMLADELQYEHNLGAILRSSMGAGVNGIIIPSKRGKGLTPVVQRVSMGGAEEVPVIRESLMSSLAQIKRAGIPIIGADMSGVPLWSVDLCGPVAFVLGGESKGVSPTVKKRCDVIVSIPLENNLDSLNVSVTAGILMFEKLRQERQRG